MGMIEDAIAFAAKAHAGQFRKGTKRPYIWHPLAVGRLLQDHGFGESIIVAGILHDTIEDAHVELDALRSQFGAEVASIVEGCTEPEHGTRSWEVRKAHTLESLRGASLEVRIVAAADKLDNLRAIAADFERVGDAVWARFNAPRDRQEWYYRGVAASIRAGVELPPPFFNLLDAEVARVFGP